MSARREVASGTAHSPTPPTPTPPPPSSPPPPPPPTTQGEPQSVTPSAADSEFSRSRSRRSRPPHRPGVEVISVQLPDASGPDRETSDLSVRYTPPYTSPNRPYRFSDHIHRDRHIFLKGASVGIGCGSDAAARSPAEEQITPLPGWSGGRGGGVGGGGGGGSSVGGGVSSACSSWDSRGCSVDGIGNVYYRGQRLQPPAMALGQDRLPTLSRVQLGLSSAACSKLQQERRRRYPHIRPHNPPAAAARRPFNEQLNTYVDTQKRIRSVHSLEDLYATSPPPVLPYLACPPSPRRRQPPPPSRPAAIRLQTAALTPQPPPIVPPPQSLMRNLTGFNIKQPPAPLVPALPLTTITGVDSSSSNAASQRNSNSNNSNDDTPKGKTVSFRDPDAELKEARKALEATKQVSSNKSYADYFLSKEVNHGTFGHLFESYPKRVLTVHPGRMVRQRTEVAVPRSRMKLQQ